jgi:hypothetical protein
MALDTPESKPNASSAGERVPRSRDRALVTLAGLFAAGLALRAWIVVAHRPALMGHFDSHVYVGSAQGDLLADPFRPAGYPFFLRAMHAVTPHLTPVVVLQHALGMATAALLYLTARRLGLGRWPALIPAAVVLLDGTHIFLEHAVLSETLFEALLASGLYACARTSGPRGLLWAAVAGALVGASSTVRIAGLLVVPVIVLWLLTGDADRRARLLGAGAAAAAAVVVAGGYLAWQNHETGSFSARGSGAALYARVAPFADCGEFEPPSGTEVLCEPTAGRPRRDPQFYVSDPGSPANRAFGGEAHSGAPEPGRFAREVLKHQPTDYAAHVARDMVRFVAPRAWLAPDTVNPTAVWLMGYLQDDYGEDVSLPALRSYYGTEQYSTSDLSALETYGEVIHVSGPVIGLLALLGVVGLAFGTGRRRQAALPFGIAVVTLLGPVATIHYEARYAVPALGPLAIAAAIGLASLADRRRGHAA